MEALFGGFLGAGSHGGFLRPPGGFLGLLGLPGMFPQDFPGVSCGIPGRLGRCGWRSCPVVVVSGGCLRPVVVRLRGCLRLVVVAWGPSGVPWVPFGFLGFSGASRGFLGLAGARARVQLSFFLVGACVQ